MQIQTLAAGKLARRNHNNVKHTLSYSNPEPSCEKLEYHDVLRYAHKLVQDSMSLTRNANY